jgi:hypothetical protein
MRVPAISSQTALSRGGAVTKPWPLFAALSLFALGWLVLAWPWLSGSVTVPWDAKAHFYPQLVFLARALHSGDSPFWTPNIFTGHPQIADPQSLIFSLPYFLLALLDRQPDFSAADAVEFFMLYLGGGAIILFFRDQDWDAAGALVAAFSFAFGASAAWRIQHVGEVVSLAWFAIALWLLARTLQRGSIAYGFAAGVVAGFMVLGRDQIAFLAALSLTGFVIWHLLRSAHRISAIKAASLPIAAGFGGGLLVAAIPFALTYALALDSNRAVIDLGGAERGSLHPASLLSFFIPNLFGVDGPLEKFWGPPSLKWGPTDLFLARNMTAVYIGALPAVVLVLMGAIRGAILERGIRFFAAAGAFTLVYALGRYTPAFKLLYLFPGVDLFRRPADATFLLGAFGAIVSGFCLDRLLAPANPRINSVEIALAVAILIAVFTTALALSLAKGTLSDAWLPLLYSGAAMLAAIAALIVLVRLPPARPIWAMVVVAALMTADLRLNNGPNESSALSPQKYDVLRPDTGNETIALLKQLLGANAGDDRRDRVELAAIDFHWPNVSLVHNFDHDLGYNPVRLKLFTEVTGAGDHVALPEQRQFAPLFPSYRSTMANLFGLRYIATGVPAEVIDKSLRPGDLPLIARTSDAFIYENKTAMPRVFFATDAVSADFEAMIKTGQWPSIDLARTILLENPPAAAPSGGAPGQVRILAYHNTEVVIEAQSPDGGFVVLNDIWHPWWYAEVDGSAAPLLRANVMFRAVAVPAGVHRVRFNFRPFAGLLQQIRACF